MAAVAQDTHDMLAGISAGDAQVLETAIGIREGQLEASGLDPSTFALVKIAALVALDAPPASYAWQVANALDDGATPEEILGVLIAVASQVGGPRVIAAAPEIMLALGLSLPDGVE
ncbi:MAG TPA: carboxymuconolactone decarboxylase family protein [Solirubrobacteraceae bacterium]|jgi:4-carboxymuconolactone decarboxylase|nr:carboxymuconolactone decarboxylase family protein [Solirubrobacteraceae bacterium]